MPATRSYSLLLVAMPILTSSVLLSLMMSRNVADVWQEMLLVWTKKRFAKRS